MDNGAGTPPVIALVGPTAVGKTAVSLHVAEALGAEIVSCDSMQVYRDMTVLSQAPSAAELARVPHHLIACADPSEPFNAGRYYDLAMPAIRDITGRGKPALLVGGTGLYVKAVVHGICEAPAADLALRKRLEAECRERGPQPLHSRLRDVDAPSAKKIHPNDARRIIRALEVYTLTGRPLSDLWREGNGHGLSEPPVIVGLTRDRQELRDRITERLLHMVYEEDVIGEARRLLRRPLSITARQMHGLGDIERYLAGQTTLKQMLDTWQTRVKQYAKRQMTWFRQTPGIQWLTIQKDEPAALTAQRVLARLRASHEKADEGTLPIAKHGT